MLKINGIEISNIEKVDENDTRQRAFCNQPYVKYKFGTPITFEQFKVNGVPAQFAEAGTRPRLRLRKSITSGGVTLWSEETPEGRRVMMNSSDEIISASENARFIVIEICAPGGGASGGGALLCGAGGGSGAYALFAVDMTEYTDVNAKSLKIDGNYAGGTGSKNREQAGDGGYIVLTGISNAPEGTPSAGEPSSVTISGGKGGNAGNGGAGGVGLILSGPSTIMKGVRFLYGSSGQSGHGEYDDEYFEAVTVSCGLEGETECEKTYGPYSGSSNACGAGASSHLGPGAAPPSSFNSNGNDATSFGAGGSGGSSKAFSSTKGGNGGLGVVNIYY